MINRKFDSSFYQRNPTTLTTIMSPRVSRRTTNVVILHQQQYGKNSRDVNEPKSQASAETLEKVPKSKPRKLISIKKKPHQKPPVIDPVHTDVTDSVDEMPLSNRLSAKKKVFTKKPVVNNTTRGSSPIFKRRMPSKNNQKVIQNSNETTPKSIQPLSSIINQKVIRNSNQTTPKSIQPLPSIINQKVIENSNQTTPKSIQPLSDIINQKVIQNSDQTTPKSIQSSPSIINQKVIQNSNQTTPKSIQPSPSTINQKVIQISKHSIQKNARNEDEVCKELFEKCNKQTLFKMMMKEFDGEEILKGYKEKRNSWDKKEMQEEAVRVLDISLENQSTSKDVKMASLQKVLQELSNLVESADEFAEMVLKTYIRQLKAEKIFEMLELDDLKRAILDKFTANDMLDLFSKTDYSSVVRQILEMASVDAIVDILKSRNNLETSQKLLKVSLEMLSEMTPESIEQTQNVPSATLNLQSGLTDAIVDAINSKKFLRTSESLLNFMLQNVIEVHSKETKKSFLNFLIKFNSDELADISHEAVKSILNQNKKGIALIDISD